MALGGRWFSAAHCSLAPSMFLRLRAQTRCCVVAMACRKLGIAIAASRPMMATTTMISMKVNPYLCFVFMAFLIFYGYHCLVAGDSYVFTVLFAVTEGGRGP